MRRLHLEAAAASGRHFAPPDRAGGCRARQSTVIAIHGRSLLSRILAYTSPALAPLYPVTPILHQLRPPGTDISPPPIDSPPPLPLHPAFPPAPTRPTTET